MISSTLVLVGGIGIFLLGMTIMTDGMRPLASTAFRRLLTEWTKSPLRGAVSGTLATAMLQSSSATTVAAVGLVGAGLLTFQQALGIIFGANIGTTLTGWIVAVLGFKLKLSVVVMPIIFIGVMLKIFGNERLRATGMALAGFSLLFFGITAMQDAMVGLKDFLQSDTLPGDSFGGRFQLLLLGAALTVITQSSSAGVATALAALSTDTITFTQAASMVIGMDVGTTFTAALATVGGSTNSKRTGYAHVIFNGLTGIMAFLLLIPISSWMNHGGQLAKSDPEIALVAFHSLFNVLGVILILGFTNQFARLVQRLVPEKSESLTEGLDPRLRSNPHAGLDAVTESMRKSAHLVGRSILISLEQLKPSEDARSLETADQALDELRSYLFEIQPDAADHLANRRKTDLLHVLDHMVRLSRRGRQKARMQTLTQDPILSEPMISFVGDLQEEQWFQPNEEIVRKLEAEVARVEIDLNRLREIEIEKEAGSQSELSDTLQRLDALRWLYRVHSHIWRISLHLLASEANGSTTSKSIA